MSKTAWWSFVAMLVAAAAVRAEPPRAGIQWYADWESGRREAQRSGRPILLVAAAPHCAGVSGIW